jgi:hypothetical protein
MIFGLFLVQNKNVPYNFKYQNIHDFSETLDLKGRVAGWQEGDRPKKFPSSFS